MTTLVSAAGPALVFNGPTDVAVATSGEVYVVESLSHRVAVVAPGANAPAVLAGSPSGSPGYANGVGTAALFDGPRTLCYHASLNRLYVVETASHRLRSIDLATGTVALLAGSGTPGNSEGVGAAASFDSPLYAVLQPTANKLWVSEIFGTRIRAVDVTTAAVSTFFTIGAGFAPLSGLAVDVTRGLLYGATFSKYIASIDYPSAAPSAQLGLVFGASSFDDMVMSPNGSEVIIADVTTSCLRRYPLPIGTGTRTQIGVCGSPGFADGPVGAANFNGARGLAWDPSNPRLLYVADTGNSAVRVVMF